MKHDKQRWQIQASSKSNWVFCHVGRSPSQVMTKTSNLII